jgi:hypothetical protein
MCRLRDRTALGLEPPFRLPPPERPLRRPRLPKARRPRDGVGVRVLASASGHGEHGAGDGPALRDISTPDRSEGGADREPGELVLVVTSPPDVAQGGIASVDVMASSSSSVVDAPLHLTYDPNVVEFVDGAVGDFLTQGGSSVVFLADGVSRPGDVAIAAGRVDREQGASGSGLLCRIRFRGLRPGSTSVLVGRAKAWGSRGEVLTVLSTGTAVAVR